MRIILPIVLLIMAPRLQAETIPGKFFPGIRFEEPLPTTFDTGQILPLDGSVDQGGVAWILFSFLPIGRGEQADFITPVREGRFAREIVFPHAAQGQYSLEIYTGQTRESLDYVGRYYGLKMLQGRGPVMLPRRFFPGFLLDQPQPTRMSTGEPLHLAGEVEDAAAHRALAFGFLSQEESSWNSFFLVEEGRFERTILVPEEAEGAHALALYAGPREGNLLPVEWYPYLEISRGAEPAEVPRLFFDGLALDEPLPVQWPLQRAVVLSGEARPFVRRFWLYLEPLDGGRRGLSPGLEDGRFRFPVRLAAGEEGPLRLSAVIELQDGTTWDAGEFVISGVDLPPPDLEVGVVAVALLAGRPGQVPLFNRGTGPVELEPPEVEGPFAVVAFPPVLVPGEAGVIELSYDGSGDDQGLLTVLSDDPFRPRVSVALSGLEAREAASDLVHLRADAAGRIEAGFDLMEQDLVFALYAAPLERTRPGTSYEISLDGSAALAKPAAARRPSRRDSVEHRARQLERALSLRLQESGRPGRQAGRGAVRGRDRRSFFFAAQGEVPDQSIEARVVAVNERAVAFVQENLREDDDNIEEDQLKEAIDLFAVDYPLLVEAFGAPSDVDGDGRIAVLVTHLIQDVDAGGQFRASSLLPRDAGGDGNMIDLMWVNPVFPAESYRALLAHEFQHLVNFNQHVLVRRGISEAPWLNERTVAPCRGSGGRPPRQRQLPPGAHLPGGAGCGGVDRRLHGRFPHARSRLPVRAQPGRPAGGGGAAAPGADRPGRPRQRRGRHRGELRRPDGPLGSAALHQRHRAERPLPVQLPHIAPADPAGPGLSPAGLGDLPPGGRAPGTGHPAQGGAVPPLRGQRNSGAEPANRAAGPSRCGGLAGGKGRGCGSDGRRPLRRHPPGPAPAAGAGYRGAAPSSGTTADSVEQINLEFVPEDGGDAQRFFLLVREGRFLRTVFFQHDEATTYSLNVYVDKRQPTPFVGRFFPIRLTQGQGPLQAPTRYFNRVRLDGPLPTSVSANQPLRISGEVEDAEATLMEFSLFPQNEDGERSRKAEQTLSLPVVAGRFDGELLFDEVPPGIYWLSLEVGPEGDLTYVGAVVSFEVLEPITAVLEEGETGPQAFALYPNYPNPFNSRTLLSFSLPESRPSVELAVYDLLGQKLAVLVRGARGPGFHSVEWNGRDGSGRPLASGSYLYRLQAGPHRAVGKLMLLR